MTQMTIRIAGLFALLLFMSGEAAAAVCTSLSAGTWNTAGRWSCGRVPGTADTVVVAHNITLNASSTIAGLTVNSGVTLADDGNGQVLTVTGNLVVNGTISNGARINVTGAASNISGTGGTFADSRLYTSGTAVTIAAGSTLNFTGAARIYTGRTEGGATVTGSVLTINGTINSTVIPGATTFLRLYANNTVIGSTGVINAGVSAATYNLGTAGVTNNGSVSLNVITQNSASNSWTQGANSSLTVSVVSTVGTLNASATGNTVTYTAPATPITPSGNTYYNLAGTGVTCPHTFTVLGSNPCVAAPGSGSVTSGPTSCSSGGGTGTIAWSPTPTTNANTNDNVLYATAGLVRGQTTQYLNCTGFNFAAIPAGATITGITVYVDRKASRAARIRDAFVYLIKGGVVSTTFNGATATSYTTADVEEAHGGAGNLWGTTWALADVTTNFGVAFAANNYSTDTRTRTASVDSIRVKIDYQSPSAPHHIRIEHDGSAVYCVPEHITLKACADDACSALYTDSAVTGITLGPTGGAYTWSPSGTVSIPAASGGSVGVTLARSSAGTAILAIAGTPSPAPASANVYECYNTATGTKNDCNLVFAGNLLAFDIPNHAAGSLQVATLTSCAASFSGKSRSIKFWATYTNPSTGTQKGMVVAGTGDVNCSTSYSALSTSSATPTKIDLTFTTSTAPQATFSLCYPDVGEMRLDARYDGSAATGDNGVVILGNDSFIAKPDHFDVTGIKCSTVNAANCGAGALAMPTSGDNPAAVDAAGGSFVRAGHLFTATVIAKNARGVTTPNFGRESVPEGVVLTATLVAPAGGNNGLLTCKGSTTNCVVAGGVANFTDGVTTISDLAWSEVGILKILPKVADANYLGAGDVVTPTYSSNIGRFYPHHFGVTQDTFDNRADWCDGGVLVSNGATCASPAFTYMGEPLNANFVLSAQNSSGSVTQNYTGVFAKLNPLAANNTLVFGAVNGADGVTPTNLTARLDTSQVVTGGSGSFAGGMASISVPLAIARNATPDGPYAALDIGIAPVDSDNVTTVFDLDTNGDTVADRTQVNNAVTEVRYGRIKLSNAHGSELLPLPLTATVQYWNGAFWVASATDSVTSLTLAATYNVLNKAGGVTGTTTPTPTGAATVANGILNINLSRPTGGAGSATVTPVGPAYLPLTSGLATFGVYKGNNEFIYLRENY